MTVILILGGAGALVLWAWISESGRKRRRGADTIWIDSGDHHHHHRHERGDDRDGPGDSVDNGDSGGDD